MARVRRPGFRRLPTVIQAEAKKKGVSPQQINSWLKLGLNVADMIGKIPVGAPDVGAEQKQDLEAEQGQVGIDAEAARSAVRKRYSQFNEEDLEKRLASSPSGAALRGAKLEGESFLAESKAIQRDAAELKTKIETEGNSPENAQAMQTLRSRQEEYDRRYSTYKSELDSAREAANKQRSALESSILAETEGKQRNALLEIDEREKAALREIRAELQEVDADSVMTMEKVLAAAPLANTLEKRERILQLATQVVHPSNLKEKVFGVDEKRKVFIQTVNKLFPALPKGISPVDTARAAKLTAEGEAATTRAEAFAGLQSDKGEAVKQRAESDAILREAQAGELKIRWNEKKEIEKLKAANKLAIAKLTAKRKAQGKVLSAKDRYNSQTQTLTLHYKEALGDLKTLRQLKKEEQSKIASLLASKPPNRGRSAWRTSRDSAIAGIRKLVSQRDAQIAKAKAATKRRLKRLQTHTGVRVNPFD